MLKPAPSLEGFAPALPQAVVHVVDRALAYDREQRWSDARAMQLAVRQAYHAAMGSPVLAAPRFSMPDPDEAATLQRPLRVQTAPQEATADGVGVPPEFARAAGAVSTAMESDPTVVSSVEAPASSSSAAASVPAGSSETAAPPAAPAQTARPAASQQRRSRDPFSRRK